MSRDSASVDTPEHDAESPDPGHSGERGRLSRWLGRFVLTMALLVSALGLGSSVANSIASHHGYQTLDVKTGSMAPHIDVGDLVVIHAVAPSSIRVGDVITFREPFGSGLVFTHRVVGISPSADGPIFATKGDHNAKADPWKIHYNGPGYRVAAVVPLAGHALTLLHSPAGRLGLWASIFGLVLALLWPVLVAEPRPAPAPAPAEVA